MAMIAGSLHDALKAAGVPEDKAMKAAEELATVSVDNLRLDTRLTRLEWMVGTVVVLQMATLGTILSFALNHLTFH